MAITYNNTVTVRDIYRYDSSANNGNGVYIGISSRYNNTTATFDYFDNDATVGDYIAFGWDFGPWNTAQISVVTALDGTGVSGVWEYLTNSSNVWASLSNVIDNTNGFTTTGVNTITFDKPNLWEPRYPQVTFTGVSTTSYNYACCAIRYRLTAVTLMNEGGANGTNLVTCKDSAIMLDGGSYRLSDILAADVAGGWGVFSNLGNCYLLNSNLRIGDKDATGSTFGTATNATTLTIRNEEVLQIGSASNFYTILLNKNTTLTLGYKNNNIISEGATICYYNCSSPYPWDNGYNIWLGSFNMYTSSFWKRSGGACDPQISTVTSVEYSILSGNSWYFANATGNLIYTTIENSGSSFYAYSSMTYNTLNIINTLYLNVGSNGITIRNIDFGTSLIYRTSNAGILTSKCLDCNFTDLDTQTIAYSDNDKCNVYFTLSIVMLDEEENVVDNVYVKVIDNQGNILFNNIWSSNLEIKVYEKFLFSTVTTVTDFNPIQIKLEKNGYESVFKKFILTNTNRNLTVTLRKRKCNSQHNSVT